MSDFNREAEFIRQVCLEAGELTLRYFGNIHSWEEKTGRGDIVTEADHAVEDLVMKRLAEQFPSHNLLTEERGWVKNDVSSPVWVLDPVDGTRNFSLGIPIYSISLACVQEGEAVVGVIYDPVHKEMFFARKGDGAFLNDHPIHVSKTPDLKEALISVSWSPLRDDTDAYIKTVERVAAYTSYFRRIGSAAIVMSYLGCGRYDGYIQSGINAWDIAAGTLIVREAGGVVTDFNGKPFDSLSNNIDMLAGNPSVHSELLQKVMLPDL